MTVGKRTPADVLPPDQYEPFLRTKSNRLPGETVVDYDQDEEALRTRVESDLELHLWQDYSHTVELNFADGSQIGHWYAKRHPMVNTRWRLHFKFRDTEFSLTDGSQQHALYRLGMLLVTAFKPDPTVEVYSG